MTAKEGDGFLHVHQSADDGDDDGSPDADVAKNPCVVQGAIAEAGAVVDVEENHQDGDGLKSHFEFSTELGAEGVAAAFHGAAEAGDEELAGEDDDDHPWGDAGDGGRVLGDALLGEVFAGEKDEAAEDQDLIDEGIDDAAEGAFDFPFSGEVSIEKIGDEGGEIDDEGDIEPDFVAVAGDGALVLVVGEHYEEDAGQNEAGGGEGVGDVAEHRSVGL